MDGAGFHIEEIDRHFWLTRSVARVMGINLSWALAHGKLTEDDYAEMVARCQSKGCRRACESWLATQTDIADTPPPDCAHGCILRRLRRAQYCN